MAVESGIFSPDPESDGNHAKEKEGRSIDRPIERHGVSVSSPNGRRRQRYFAEHRVPRSYICPVARSHIAGLTSYLLLLCYFSLVTRHVLLSPSTCRR